MSTQRDSEEPKRPQPTWLRPSHADDAAAVFTWKPTNFTDSVTHAHVALDTNVLLIPYTVSSQSVQAIENVYRRLAAEGRLTVPGQVAREFARNRILKIGQLRQNINDIKSRVQLPDLGRYPLIESLEAYQLAQQQHAALTISLGAYKKALTTLVKTLDGWAPSDPVTDVYGQVFSGDVILDPDFNEEEVRSDLSKRQEQRLPPGYKDQSKADEGVGDLLIWRTILSRMSGTESDLVFVTGEEKSDWWHKSGGSTLLPRLELIDEYRQVSGGGTFHLSSLAGFLEAMEASAEVVTEVRESRGWQQSVDPSQAHYLRIFDNRIVLIRGADGLAAVLPIKQRTSTADDNYIEYLSWGPIPNAVEPKDLLDAVPLDGRSHEGGSAYLRIGPYVIPWSAGGDGYGYLYVHGYDSATNSVPYQLGPTDVPRLDLIDYTLTRFTE